MAFQSVYDNGRMRMLSVDVSDETREDWLARQEEQRVAGVRRRRMYYDGEQYLLENLETMAANGLDPLKDRLPEHMRKHAYSTQVAECIDFLADQMTKTFEVEAVDKAVQPWIEALIGSVEDQTDLVREALSVGDVALRFDWDEVTDKPRALVYESERVRFDYDQEDRTVLEKVVMDEVVWAYDGFGVERQRLRRTSWRYASGVETEDARGEIQFEVDEDGLLVLPPPLVVKTVQYDDDAEIVMPIEWPFIPWALMRGSRKSMSSTRGEAMITTQAMETADRYNAVQQVGWLIARYNSHGNVAVVGDAATLQVEQSEGVAKDVADVLTFPGGTAIQTITLPTDPQMIIQQEKALLEGLYGVFGLTRIDPDSVQGMGALSGYALEILNRKTDGTFDRIRKQWALDLKAALGLALDLVTARTQEVFVNREMDVRLGGAYIVDDAQIRDDYTAGLLSREEALRQRGMGDEEIKKIIEEIDAAAPPEPEVGTFGLGQVGLGVVPNPEVEATA